MDAALNLFFYTPLGFAGFLAIRHGWLGWLLAIAAGSGLSWGIEWLQLWSVSRYGNLTDLTFNVAGTLAGASAAFVATRWHWFPHGLTPGGTTSRWRLTSVGVLFLAVWMSWQMFPFIPALSLGRLTDFVTLLAPWSWRGFVEALAGFGVLRFAAGRSPWLWFALAAVPAQAFLLDRAFAGSTLCGAGLGWAVAELAGAAGIRWMAIGLPTWLLFEELRPFSFTRDANPYHWAPFETWYEVSGETYYPVIFGKLFLDLAVIWVLRKRNGSWVWSAGVPGAILAGGEWMQQHIPGRTPESTDLVLLVAAAVLLTLTVRSELRELAVQRQ
jgi:VanZ family protein